MDKIVKINYNKKMHFNQIMAKKHIDRHKGRLKMDAKLTPAEIKIIIYVLDGYLQGPELDENLPRQVRVDRLLAKLGRLIK